MGEAIIITSGKGGSGKSTLTVNCGAALAVMGKKVLLVDADAGLRALDLMLSVSGKVVYDLSDVLSGRCVPVKAIVETDIYNLHILPAPAAADEGVFDEESMRGLCKGLTHYYDYVMIDSPAGIGSGTMAAVAAADRAIIVATADPVCIRDADRMATAIIARGLSDVRLVVNRVVPKLIKKGIISGIDKAIDGAALQLIGIVPEDDRVVISVYEGKPVIYSRRGAAAAFNNIARRISGEDVPLMKL